MKQTAEKPAPDALTAEALYASLFESGALPVLLVDAATGVIESANAAAVVFYGYASDMLKGLNMAEILSVEQAGVPAALQRAADMRTARQQHIHAGGHTRRVETTFWPLTVNRRQKWICLIRETADAAPPHEVVIESKAREQGTRALLEFTHFKDAAVSIFDSCKKLVGAASGYVALLTPDGMENDVLYLDPGGIECDVDHTLPMPIRGLRAEAYEQQIPVYDNNFLNSKHYAFIPDGHVPLESVMFAPIRINGAVVGLIGLGNKPGGFTDDDARIAGIFGDFAALALQNSRILDQLESSKSDFHLVFDNANDIIFILDPDGHFIHTNRCATERLGYTPEEFRTMTPRDIDTPEHAEKVPERLKEIQEKGYSVFETEHVARDGRIIPSEVNMRMIEYRGKPALLSIVRDITERHRRREMLERQGAVFRAINAVFEAALTCESDEDVADAGLRASMELTGSAFGFIGEVNDQGLFNNFALADPGWDACRMSRAEAAIKLKNMKMSSYWGGVIRDASPAIVNDPDNHPARTGVPEGHPPITSFLGVPLMFNGGAIGTIALANKPGGYDKNDLEAMEMLAAAYMQALNRKRIEESLKESTAQLRREVTQRRQSEQQLQILLKDLESANRELEDFAYVVSHDLKAPLRGIISLADWLSEDYGERLDDEGREYIQDIIGRTQRMHNLIDGILQYSRAGRARATLERVDAGAVVRDVIQTLAPPQDISIAPDGALPEVIYDRTHLEQIFQNLIGNAVQHLGRDSGEVRITCRQDESAWTFRVADNGAGIDPQHFEHIFKIFQSLNPGKSGVSTGIGLALVKRLVERNRGAVWVESEPGSGCAFYFTIPRSLVPEAAPRTALIVDANEEFSAAAAKLLARDGHTSIQAASGREALDILSDVNSRVDVVLLDAQPPDMPASQLIRDLLRINPGLNIYLCTEESDREILKDEHGPAVRGFLAKPFEQDALFTAMCDANGPGSDTQDGRE